MMLHALILLCALDGGYCQIYKSPFESKDRAACMQVVPPLFKSAMNGYKEDRPGDVDPDVGIFCLTDQQTFTLFPGLKGIPVTGGGPTKQS